MRKIIKSKRDKMKGKNIAVEQFKMIKLLKESNKGDTSCYMDSL